MKHQRKGNICLQTVVKTFFFSKRMCLSKDQLTNVKRNYEKGLDFPHYFFRFFFDPFVLSTFLLIKNAAIKFHQNI